MDARTIAARTIAAGLVASGACAEGSYRLGSAEVAGTGGAAGNTFIEAGVTGRGGATSPGRGGTGGVGGHAGSAGLAGGSGCGGGDAGWCASSTVTREQWGADVIVVVDTAPSMATEILELQQGLNGFAGMIAGAGVSVNLTLLAAPRAGTTSPEFCVPAPLGSGACSPPGADSALPRLFHHPDASLNDVDNDVVNLLHETWNEIELNLRPDAQKTLLMISDGDGAPDLLGSFVLGFLLAPRPPLLVAAIYAQSACPAARAVGTEYRRLVDPLSGIQVDLCSEPMDASLTRVAESIVARRACVLPVPRFEGGYDPFRLRVELGRLGETRTLNQVASAAECDPVNGGFYVSSTYPDSSSTRLCPASCDLVLQDPLWGVTTWVGCLSAVPC